MGIKKTAAIVATAGALAAVAMPAMAFENEFHGTSRLRYFLSNYENGGGGNPLATGATGYVGTVTGNATDNLKMNNYFEQRTRIFYTAKASDDLKLVTGFEIDSVFGDRAQGLTSYGSTAGAVPTATTTANAAGATGRNVGGGLESDTVNLETKWVYLDFKIPSTPIRIIAGIQPIKDQLKGIFLDADAAGIMTSSKLGSATINAGYLRGYDQSYFGYTTATPNTATTTATNPAVRGINNLNIGLTEAIFAPSKDLKFAGVYYLYDDARGIYGNDLQIHLFGLTAEAKMGALTLSGFGAYQGGIIKGLGATNDSAFLNAFAYNLAAKAAVGPGTFKTAMLFTSGNDQNASTGAKHLTGWVGTTQSQNNAWNANNGTSTYNESGMMLLNRNAASGTGTTDNALVYNTGNGLTPATMQGLYLYTLGYDANITPKFYTNVNAGIAWTAHTNSLKPVDRATGVKNATNYMGTEVNLETGYKMYDNLTASLQAAYVILGGYYTGSSTYGTSATNVKDPENPYTIRTSLIYNF